MKTTSPLQFLHETSLHCPYSQVTSREQFQESEDVSHAKLVYILCSGINRMQEERYAFIHNKKVSDSVRFLSYLGETRNRKL